MLELREMIQKFLSEGNEVVNSIESNSTEYNKEEIKSPEAANPNEEDSTIKSEDDQKIIQILDEYIKPAVEQDGGAINFKSYKDGVVTVILRGACSGCPSSTLTLKAGIEGVLKRLIPEVKEVVAEEL